MKEIQILNNGDALYDIRRKINENFELVQTEVEEVVVDPLAKFGINEGNVTDGVADLLTVTDNTLSFKVGGEYPNLVMTSGDGVTTEIESVNDLHLQNLADGEYKILVNGEASQVSGSEFYSQLTEPQNINNGDVWFNGESTKQYLTDAPSVTPITPKTTINYKCMGNIGDLYIAAGGGQYFYISRDAGTTWESRVLPANVSGFLSCVVKDGYFYFATSTSSIMRTAEGEDPEVFHKFADTFYPQKIKIINDLFVLTASGPTLSTSSDGQTWNTITIGTEPIIDVFYINDLYYIISRNGTVYTSEDLITVTQKNKIEQSTYVQCAEIYKNTIIMGGISGSLYIYNLDTDEITLNNISSSEVILDMQVRPNGAMIFVGSNNMCKITYDFITYQNLYTSGGYLEHIYKDFIMGQAGSFLRINQTVQWFDYPWVPIGELTISGGQVTYFTTYPYNSNGLHEASSSTFGLLRTAAVTDEMDCTCNDAVITPSNLYDLSNYRMANTSYEVDDKVGCPYHHNLQLKCTQAGTTSNEGLNTKGYLEPGTTIEDGSVIWEVEELGTGSGGGHTMFDTVLKDHILTYEESKGLALQGTYVYKEAIAGSRYGYPDFYNKCLEEKEQATAKEVTLAGLTITLYINRNGHQFYDIADKDIVDNFFNIIGSAWFYGIDTENERIFLPRNNYFEQATVDVSEVAQSVGAGLPNITGDIVVTSNYSGVVATDAFYDTGKTATDIKTGGSGATSGQAPIIGMDASKASAIYGNSNTVQPNAVKKLLYICVGNTESKSTITDVVDVTTTENDTTPIFTGMYFDFKPNNVSWLIGGGQASNAGIYAFTYNELVNVLNGETKYGNLKVINEADMIAGVDYSEYWKVNQDEMYFITPTAISNKALSGAVVGNGKTLGLTNGTKNGGLAGYSNGSTNANIAYVGVYGVNVGNTTTGTSITGSLGITTDPTKSGIIAEQATAQLYFKVANAVQNLELLDAGEVLEAVNSIIPNNKALIISYGMPDFASRISLTWNTVHQLPCDAVVLWCGYSSSTTDDVKVLVSQDNVTYYSYGAMDSGWLVTMGCPLPKGTYFKGTGGKSYQELWYMPLKGAN